MKEKHRLFLALKLEPEDRRKLTEYIEGKERAGIRGTKCSESNLHLTLDFIGNMENPEEVLSLFRKREPLGITLHPSVTSVGYIRPEIIVSFLRKEEDLMSFQKEITTILVENGIPFDDRHSYTPHITLFYHVKNEPDQIPLENIPLQLTFRFFTLYESITETEKGICYKELESFHI